MGATEWTLVAVGAVGLAVWGGWAWWIWRGDVIRLLTEIRDLLRKEEE